MMQPKVILAPIDFSDPSLQALEILRIADAEHADLIVIATHGRTGLRRLAFGSVTEKIVRTADCPVLVLRKNAAAESADADTKAASAAV
jgi:hypothetical protein